MRIQHNITAMNAYRNYNKNTSAVGKNLEKLSSGYKINRAGDDAAGLAVSQKMRLQIAGLAQAQKNAKSGISLVQTAEGALQEVHEMLERMYTIAEQSANGTFDAETDRAQLQKELESLQNEITRIGKTANFNGIGIFKQYEGSGAANITAVDASAEDPTVTNGVGAAPGPTASKVDGTATEKAVTITAAKDGGDNLKDALGGVSDIGDGAVTVQWDATGSKWKIGVGEKTFDATGTFAAGVLTLKDGSNKDVMTLTASDTTNSSEAMFKEAFKTAVDTGISYTSGGSAAVDATNAKSDIELMHFTAADGGALKGALDGVDGIATDNIKVDYNTSTTSKWTIDVGGKKVTADSAEFNAGVLTLKDAEGNALLTLTASDTTNASAALMQTAYTTAVDTGLKYTAAGTSTGSTSITINVADITEGTTIKLGDGEAQEIAVPDDATALKETLEGLTLPDGYSLTVTNTETACTLTLTADEESDLDADALGDLITLEKPGTVTPAETTVDFANKTGKDMIGKSMTVNGRKYEFVKAAADASDDATAITVAETTTAEELATALAGAIGASINVTEGGATISYTVAAGDGTDGNPATQVKITGPEDNGTAEAIEVTSGGKANDIWFAIGAEPTPSNKLTLGAMDLSLGAIGITPNAAAAAEAGEVTSRVGVMSARIDTVRIDTQQDAWDSLQTIKNATNAVSDMRGSLGAVQNRLDHTINNLSVMQENMQDAESVIRDTDVAEEMMAYTKNNILVQSAQAMLAQANQLPQGVLQLLG